MIRSRTIVIALVGALLIAGCGGGGGASKGDYQASIDLFCKSIKGAATRVQTDATKLQSSAATNPKAAITGFGTTLQRFADDTRSALTAFRKTGVPSDYKDFNDKAVTGFDGVIAKLTAAAKAAKAGNAAALTSLGTDLSSVKLPNLPKDIAGKAKNCADISSSS